MLLIACVGCAFAALPPLADNGYCQNLTMDLIMTHRSGFRSYHNFTEHVLLTELGFTADQLLDEYSDAPDFMKDQLLSTPFARYMAEYQIRHRMNASYPAAPLLSSSLYVPDDSAYFGRAFDASRFGQRYYTETHNTQLMAAVLEVALCRSYSSLVAKRYPGCRTRYEYNLQQTSWQQAYASDTFANDSMFASRYWPPFDDIPWYWNMDKREEGFSGLLTPSYAIFNTAGALYCNATGMHRIAQAMRQNEQGLNTSCGVLQDNGDVYCRDVKRELHFGRLGRVLFKGGRGYSEIVYAPDVNLTVSAFFGSERGDGDLLQFLSDHLDDVQQCVTQSQCDAIFAAFRTVMLDQFMFNDTNEAYRSYAYHLILEGSDGKLHSLHDGVNHRSTPNLPYTLDTYHDVASVIKTATSILVLENNLVDYDVQSLCQPDAYNRSCASTTTNDDGSDAWMYSLLIPVVVVVVYVVDKCS